MRTYGNKIYTNFSDINVSVDDIECESIDSLLIYSKKYYLEIYLFNCTYKMVNNKWQIIKYFMKIFLKIRNYRCSIMIALI